MSAPFSIRPATFEDALSIAKTQVAVWHTAYRDILPGALMDRMTVPDREKGWQRILEAYEASGCGAVFVAEQEGKVVGFLSCGDQRDDALLGRFSGEISAIYVEASRQGIGTGLMAAGARALLDMGHEAAALWVLSENAVARAFYESLQGAQVAERLAEDGMSEVAYGWASLSELARA
ncbi:GNAT family N-acetyltransferase [Celeribacter naphthalenivorans]|uniref:GNAT family N-acetyltransferase n=1 Tax=Celeribacter naphthalenivorans TaxID=1614694 RepID=UPI001CF94E34|nr:GNAT family N-acetyltransferase [Celeribacter naphthalenivorans]